MKQMCFKLKTKYTLKSDLEITRIFFIGQGELFNANRNILNNVEFGFCSRNLIMENAS